MKMTRGKNKFFILALLIALIIAFAVHVILHNAYKFPLFGSFVILSYAFNFTYVLAEVWFLQKWQRKDNANLGNAYLGLSMFKFLIFFALFIPLFRRDGVMDHFEFFGFFVPYSISLLAGTVFLIQMLKESDLKPK